MTHQIEIIRDADMLILDGSITMPIGAYDGAHGAECEPTAAFWQAWHHDKDGIRAAGLQPYKDDYGVWCCRFSEQVRR